jgi:spore germination protein
MCYDQYCPAYKYADPGPVSALAWSEAVINYAASVIPLDKLIMGIPFYGMDFDTVDHTKSRWIFYREASQLREKHGVQEEWHESFGVPHFNYIDESLHPHEVWYENGRSVAGKVSIAAKYGIRGISCWAIADENPDVWPAAARSLGSK